MKQRLKENSIIVDNRTIYEGTYFYLPNKRKPQPAKTIHMESSITHGNNQPPTVGSDLMNGGGLYTTPEENMLFPNQNGNEIPLYVNNETLMDESIQRHNLNAGDIPSSPLQENNVQMMMQQNSLVNYQGSPTYVHNERLDDQQQHHHMLMAGQHNLEQSPLLDRNGQMSMGLMDNQSPRMMPNGNQVMNNEQLDNQRMVSPSHQILNSPQQMMNNQQVENQQILSNNHQQILSNESLQMMSSNQQLIPNNQQLMMNNGQMLPNNQHIPTEGFRQQQQQVMSNEHSPTYHHQTLQRLDVQSDTQQNPLTEIQSNSRPVEQQHSLSPLPSPIMTSPQSILPSQPTMDIENYTEERDKVRTRNIKRDEFPKNRVLRSLKNKTRNQLHYENKNPQFKDRKVKRRHSITMMESVEYNSLSQNHEEELKKSFNDHKNRDEAVGSHIAKDNLSPYQESLLSLKVGPGKHQVKEFNILPVNVLKLKYKSKSSDYIVVKLICDKSMKMSEYEIFILAVSAYHSKEDPNHIHLPNLKISQQMLRGRTKGYLFRLKYILVIDGVEVEQIESDEFYLWSNINQKGFPREERMSYVTKAKGNRKRRR